ncbi:MAG: hypothetical protein AAF363_03275 [Bacteroidota bacterium]
MDDKLRKYFEENRSHFDSDEPSEKVWNQIESGLGHKKNADQKQPFFWKAAAVILFAVSGLLLMERQWGGKGLNENQARVIISDEFQEAKGFYASLIEQKKDELQELADENPRIVQDFGHDLRELDSLYVILEEEYKVTKNEKIVDALIDNLKIRIKVLNSQINIMEQINQEKRNNDEYNI